MKRARALLLAALTVAVFAALAEPAAASTDSTYTVYARGGPNAGSLETPHKDYLLTTQKCSVCHAVHKAPTDGEILLPTTAAGSCVYCHITTTLGGIILYGGDPTKYTTASVFGHDIGESNAAGCTQCHSVHGANTMGGTVSVANLKAGGYQQSFVDEIALGDGSKITRGTGPWGAGWSSTDSVQLTGFCTRCHAYYADSWADSITATNWAADGSTYVTTTRTHPMGRTQTGSINPVQVAIWTTDGCTTCHMRSPQGTHQIGVPAYSFPHYTTDHARFLRSWKAPNGQEVQNPAVDGVCNTCHQWGEWPDIMGDPKHGVGFDY